MKILFFILSFLFGCVNSESSSFSSAENELAQSVIKPEKTVSDYNFKSAESDIISIDSLRYYVRVRGMFYLLNAQGAILKRVDINNYLSHNRNVNHFNESTLPIILEHKNESTLISMDRNGKWKRLDKKYKAYKYMGSKVMGLKLEDRVHYFNAEFEALFPNLEISNAKPFHEGVTAVQQSNEWIVIDESGKTLFSLGSGLTSYDIGDSHEGYIKVKDNQGFYKLYNHKGESIDVNALVNNQKIRYVGEVSDQSICVVTGTHELYQRVHYFNLDGSLIWDSKRIEVRAWKNFVSGQATIHLWNNTWDDDKSNADPTKMVERNSHSVIIDKNGTELTDDSRGNAVECKGKMVYCKNGLYNLEDKKIAIDVKRVTFFDDYRIIRDSDKGSPINDKMQMLDYTGNILWEASSEEQSKSEDYDLHINVEKVIEH